MVCWIKKVEKKKHTPGCDGVWGLEVGVGVGELAASTIESNGQKVLFCAAVPSLEF